MALDSPGNAKTLELTHGTTDFGPGGILDAP
jgi:hypothetical protein